MAVNLAAEEASPLRAPWPSARVGWYAVFLISLSLLVNFLDRGILSLLVPAIKADLKLTDTQISL
ncbi:MAG: MFS transporter, partial [Phenylobacterium sp.]